MPTIESFRARKPMRIGLEQRQPGQLVPEAHTFNLVESLIHGGFLVRQNVQEDEFRGAVEKFCPEMAIELSSITGVELPDSEPESSMPQNPQNTQITKFPRSELEEMTLPELRELADGSGIKSRKKSDFVSALAAD